MKCTWRVEMGEGHWQRIHLTILAYNHENKLLPPKTKKTSSNFTTITLKDGRKFQKLFPSKPYQKWERACIRSMKPCFSEMKLQGLWEITDFMNCEANIFFKGPEGDTVGYQQAIGDMLEVSGLISNDKQIESWDGSRRHHVKDWPRLELCLTFLWPASDKKAKKAKKAKGPSVKVASVLPSAKGLPLFDGNGN